MVDVYKEGLSLYKIGKIKEAMRKFAAVAKDHIKYGHAQMAGNKLKNMTANEIPKMVKHTAEERQTIKEDRSKKLDEYYKKSKTAKNEEEMKKAEKRAYKIIISKPSEKKER